MGSHDADEELQILAMEAEVDRDRETLEELRFWIKGAGTPEERVPPPQAEADRALGSALERLEAADKDALHELHMKKQAEAEVERLRTIIQRLYDDAGYVSEEVWDDIEKALKGEEKP